MKIPCEIVVWQVLPLIRRELAKALVRGHGMTQSEVARMFGVTDAAISQYLTEKRGGEYSSSRYYPGFLEEIEASAARLAEEGADYGNELCCLCAYVKGSGFVDERYTQKTGSPPPKCEGIATHR